MTVVWQQQKTKRSCRERATLQYVGGGAGRGVGRGGRKGRRGQNVVLVARVVALVGASVGEGDKIQKGVTWAKHEM